MRLDRRMKGSYRGPRQVLQHVMAPIPQLYAIVSWLKRPCHCRRSTSLILSWTILPFGRAASFALGTRMVQKEHYNTCIRDCRASPTLLVAVGRSAQSHILHSSPEFMRESGIGGRFGLGRTRAWPRKHFALSPRNRSALCPAIRALHIYLRFRK